METTRNTTEKTYELQGSYTFTGTCTCGLCKTSLRDESGNIDYGYQWKVAARDYLPRACEVAARRREGR